MARLTSLDRRRQERIASEGFTRLLLLAFGIAIALGLATGLLWTGWSLVRLHVLP